VSRPPRLSWPTVVDCLHPFFPNASTAHSKARRGNCEDAVATVQSMERRIAALPAKQRKSRESIVRRAKNVVGRLCERDDDGNAVRAQKKVAVVQVTAKDKSALDEGQMVKLLIGLGIHPDKWLEKDADPFTRNKMVEAFNQKQADGRGKKK